MPSCVLTLHKNPAFISQQMLLFGYGGLEQFQTIRFCYRERPVGYVQFDENPVRVR